jgi:hypothetical protein
MRATDSQLVPARRRSYCALNGAFQCLVAELRDLVRDSLKALYDISNMDQDRRLLIWGAALHLVLNDAKTKFENEVTAGEKLIRNTVQTQGHISKDERKELDAFADLLRWANAHNPGAVKRLLRIILE